MRGARATAVQPLLWWLVDMSDLDAPPASPRLARRKLLGLGAAASAMLFGNGCAYLLYPDRKGRDGGVIDTGPFIVDLLWLLPGLVPGVVCLIVDFTTGCIYRGGGGGIGKNETPVPNGRKDPPMAEVMLDGVVVAKGVRDQEDPTKLKLTWRAGVDRAAVQERGELVFRRHDAATAAGFVNTLV